jgi:hypothetical protein
MPSASSSTCSHRPSAPTTSSIQAIHGQRENALAVLFKLQEVQRGVAASGPTG